MSNVYVDRTGFEHPKYCMSCSKFILNSSKHNGLAYCEGHRITWLEEPFKSYYRQGQNTCPYCYPQSAD